MNRTPQSNRVHIIIVGKRNSGKSSLLNAITGQATSIVSSTPGTTTDVVSKAMEISGIGPSLFIDTPGLDDVGELGEMRVQQAINSLDRADVALVLCDEDLEALNDLVILLKNKQIPFVPIINKVDLLEEADRLNRLSAEIERAFSIKPLRVSAKMNQGIDKVIEAIVANNPNKTNQATITGDRVQAGDLVLLVMPQDAQAPAGRLILPQAQTTRELLDKNCLIMSCTPDMLKQSLEVLAIPPKMIITDSQSFKKVYELKPEQTQLTSFSVLFAAYKGDINYFKQGASVIDRLQKSSKVLIAEACTHAPETEDIGRVKLPRLLRKRVGEELTIDIVSGKDFPEDLSTYDLVIHCGACMFNRKYMLSRVDTAKEQQVPMTNYGVALAHLNGVPLE